MIDKIAGNIGRRASTLVCVSLNDEISFGLTGKTDEDAPPPPSLSSIATAAAATPAVDNEASTVCRCRWRVKIVVGSSHPKKSRNVVPCFKVAVPVAVVFFYVLYSHFVIDCFMQSLQADDGKVYRLNLFAVVQSSSLSHLSWLSNYRVDEINNNKFYRAPLWGKSCKMWTPLSIHEASRPG